MKQDFSSEEDLCSKDYHAEKKKYQTKNRLWEAYMRYVNARIYLLESIIAKKMGQSTEAKTKENAARALFSTLCQGKYAISRFLVQQARQGIQDASS